MGIFFYLVLIAPKGWVKTYNRLPVDSFYNDTLYSIEYDTVDNAYIIVGHTERGPLGGLDILVTKVEANGSIVWQKVYGLSSDDYGRCVTIDYTEEGSFYIVTGYGNFPGKESRIIVFKVQGVNGNLVWGYYYRGFWDQEVLSLFSYSIVKDGESYLITGNVEPGPCGGNSDVLVVSVNSLNGGVNWARIYGKKGKIDDYGYSIIEDSTTLPCSLFVVAGKSYVEGENSHSHILVFKGRKKDGTIDSATRYNYALSVGQYRCGYSIKNDFQHTGYVLTGDVDSSIFVMKLNANLSVGWGGKCRVYTIPDTSTSRCIEVTSDSNYILTGSTNPGIAGLFDLLIIKIKPTGTIMWSKVVTGCQSTTSWMNLNDYGEEIIEDGDGMYVAIGYTLWPSVWSSTNLLVVKTNKNGDTDCQQSSDSCLREVNPLVDSPYVKIDTMECNFEISMELIEIDSSEISLRDTVICEYSVKVEEIEHHHKSCFVNVYSVPNPVTGVITLHYTLTIETKVKISIYNLSGQLIQILVDKHLKEGTHKAVWDRKNRKGEVVPPGVYFYKICADKEKKVGKIIIH